MNEKQTILIVDDSKFNRDILKEILGETYHYLEAEKRKSGHSADRRSSGNRSDTFGYPYATDGWF